MSSMKLRDTPARTRRTLSHPQSLPSVHEREEQIASGSDPAPSSPEFQLDTDKKETAWTRPGTPPYRTQKSSSVISGQKDFARKADPNGGRCLLTGRDAAVQACHIVARATDSKQVTQLEYAWGLGWQEFNADTRENFIFLRADWHVLLDKDQWMLIPEESDLETLTELTATPTLGCLNKFYNSKKTFKYHFLPMATMNESICRYDKNGHTTFEPPFLDFGILISHVQPHYVIFNTGKKLENLGFVKAMALARHLHQIATHSAASSTRVSDPRLGSILDLYTTWMTAALPESYLPPDQTSGPSKSPSDQGDKPDEGQRQLRSRRGANSIQQDPFDGGSQGASGATGAGQQRAHVVDVDIGEGSDITVESTMNDEEWNSSEETAWIEEISQWEDKGSKEATSVGGWESAVLNDDQVAKYRDETVSALSTADWRDWQPSWLAVRRVLY